jgi:hypothetical protein
LTKETRNPNTLHERSVVRTKAIDLKPPHILYSFLKCEEEEEEEEEEEVGVLRDTTFITRERESLTAL